MPKFGNIAICALLILAGCSTSWKRERVTDWNAPATNQPPSETHRPVTPTISRQPQAVTNKLVETWIPLERWSAASGLGPVRRVSLTPRPIFEIQTTNGLLVIQTDSLLAYWNKLRFRLGFAPQLVGGQPYVQTLDLAKNIEPLLSKPSFLSKTNEVAVIDPGHGGSNLGAHSVISNALEKEFTLDWALRLKPLLETNGWQVFLTRTNDVDMSLPDRVAFATQHHADLFVSLHFNSAAPDENQRGLETYCLTPAGMPSSLTRGYSDDLSQAFPNNAFDMENWQLAFRLQRVLLRITGDEDRGVRHARFMGVLRGQNCPAVLIEGGYLSNPQQARLIADSDYRQMLAEAVAEALTGKPIAEYQLLAATNHNSLSVSNLSPQVSATVSTSTESTNGN